VPAANPLASTAGAGASTSLPALTGFQSYMQQARQQPSPPPVAPAPKPPQATAGQSHEEEPARESAHAAPTAPDRPASSRASQKLQARLPSLQGKVDAAAARQADRPSEPTPDHAASTVDQTSDEAPADTLAEPREAQAGANDAAQAQNFQPAMVRQAEQAQEDPGEALAGQSKPGSRKADRKGGLDLRGSASPVSAQSRSVEEGASSAGQPASASGPEGFSAQLAKALPQEGPAMGGLTPDASQAGAGAAGAFFHGAALGGDRRRAASQVEPALAVCLARARLRLPGKGLTRVLLRLFGLPDHGGLKVLSLGGVVGAGLGFARFGQGVGGRLVTGLVDRAGGVIWSGFGWPVGLAGGGGIDLALQRWQAGLQLLGGPGRSRPVRRRGRGMGGFAGRLFFV
jgi:hypothetical protein